MNKPIVLIWIALGLNPRAATASDLKIPPRDTGRDRWEATDALGRALPGFKECGPPRSNRSVAIFYFLWMDPEVSRRQGALFDISKLLKANRDKPAYGPAGAFHWWGEPRLGYYLSNDPFVIRKHAQMLADAGVDAIAFDVTNGPTYDESVLAIRRVFEEIRSEGGKTPQFFFLTHSRSDQVAQGLFDRYYRADFAPDLWFRWNGKPLLLAPETGLSAEVKAFFTIRQSWAWSDPKGWFGDGRDKWTWLDHTPQQPGWHDAPNKPEEVSVATAEHATSNIGRSFHDRKQPPRGAVRSGSGLYFAEQWSRALKVDPALVFVTGWNEWIAQRFVNTGGAQFLGKPLATGETFFVDQFNQEYSRDIEPMRGGHGDNYYCQLVANVRRYKGVRPPLKASPPRTIQIAGGFDQWAGVGPEYLDDLGDVAHRNHPGWGRPGDRTYVNNSGRNDIDAAKVARDADHLYFYARTRAPLTPPGVGGAWMLLLLDADNDHRTGWEGYDFLVNRSVKGGVSSVERNAGGWKWTPAGTAAIRVEGRELHLSLPRATIGLTRSAGPIRLDFKWADHVPDSGDILDFLDQGDVAPNARFNARYEE